MRILIVIILMLLCALAHGQTHTMPGSNVVPSGASLTIQSGATITAAGGSTVTGFGTGGGAPTTATYITQTTDSGLSAEVALSSLATGLLKSTTTTGALTTVTDNSTNWNTAFTQMLQWDGGATNLVAATGRTNLGGTTVGQSFFTLTNPGAITFPEISAGNAVSAKTAAQLKTDLSLTIGTDVQAFDSDLTSWAAITRASGIDTWVTTPNSANLRSALTDENGTGALLFSGATTPDFTTGFTIGAAAASGKILIGNGTNYVPSTPTYPNVATGTGTILQANGTNWIASTPTWPTAAGTAGYTIRSDGTNVASYPQDMLNSSTANVTSSYNADTYLVGSSVVVAAGDIKLKGQYHCVFDMAKNGAGTGAVVITVRAGTAGTTGDTAIMTFTFGAGTGVADYAVFDVWVNIRTTGASATSAGVCLGRHNLATTGVFSNAAVFMPTSAANASFNSTTATTIGLSFSGGTTFTGTNTLVQATLVQ